MQLKEEITSTTLRSPSPTFLLPSTAGALGPGEVPGSKLQPGFTLGARPSAGQKPILSPSASPASLGGEKCYLFFYGGAEGCEKNNLSA